MNIKSFTLTLGLFLALALPSSAFSAEAPLVLAKDEAKCDICLKKLTATCEGEFKLCASKDGAAACQAYFEKCKASVPKRCGGPTLCD